MEEKWIACLEKYDYIVRKIRGRTNYYRGSGQTFRTDGKMFEIFNVYNTPEEALMAARERKEQRLLEELAVKKESQKRIKKISAGKFFLDK